jgi:hypothetical protein
VQKKKLWSTLSFEPSSTTVLHVTLPCRLFLHGSWNAHGRNQDLILQACHTWFLSLKPDAHRIYVQDQVVIHTARM